MTKLMTFAVAIALVGRRYRRHGTTRAEPGNAADGDAISGRSAGPQQRHGDR